MGILALPDTKGGHRYNIRESIPITNHYLLQAFAAGKDRFTPNKFLVRSSPAQFRDLFAKAVHHAKLPSKNWQPYSIRRGGVTQHFRDWGNMDATCVRGRWANMRNCRIYVNDANAAASDMKVTPGQSAWHGKLQQLQARLRQTWRAG